MMPNGWELRELKDLTAIYDGTHSTPKYVEYGVPFYSVEHLTKGDFSITKFISEEVFEKENRRVKLERNDILMTRIGDIGTAVHLDWNVRASFYVSLALLKASVYFDSSFMTHYINSSEFHRELWKRIIHVAFPKKINLGEIGKCHVLLPPLPEQRKIAKILSTWDKAISTTERLIDNSKQRKKALMQQLLTGNKRLLDDSGKPFEGEWEEVKLSHFFERVMEKNNGQSKNVVTISAQHGLIRQEEFFKKSVASETLDNYFILRKGQFAYNKSYSNGYPMGAIKRLNRYDDAVVTSLYICFELKDEQLASSCFMEQFFESGLLNRGLTKVAAEGGRAHGLLNVKPADFMALSMAVPKINEQQKIASVLTNADKEIELLEQQLADLKQEKKALMQQLLTGKRRVNT